ncbi:MAG: DNA alkylation repair protein [Thermoanaerobaculia bacterium]|nr:DNA alkylation repair protein [Thermoanaerobaculia bacterium]
MDYASVMADLESHGTGEVLAVLRDQGAEGEAYGVPAQHLREIAAHCGIDQELAQSLWSSRNVDARLLAVQIADPGAMAADDLDAWAHDVTYYPLIDHLIHLVVQTPHAVELIERWIGSGHEFVERCGFLTMAQLAKDGREIEVRELESQLETIEGHIRSSTVRAKHELGAALVTIGRRNDRLQELTMEVARKIGRIRIEHPELGTIESDAVELLRNPTLAERLIRKTHEE